VTLGFGAGDPQREPAGEDGQEGNETP